MAVPVEVIPALATAGTAISSAIGVFLDRRRRQAERQEPGLIEEQAAAAVKSVVEPPPADITSVHGHRDPVVASTEEVTEAVTKAVRQELARAESQSKRYTFWTGVAFFIAGVLATIAITLFVHPVSGDSSRTRTPNPRPSRSAASQVGPHDRNAPVA